MKKIFLIILVILAVVAVISTNSSAFAQEESAAKVIVYYFHGNFRCPTCTTMEKYSKEAIEMYFKDALLAGSLEFREVNVDQRGNEHFVNDYQLYTRSLVVSLVRDGEQGKYKNLDKIWQLALNKQKFIEYVASEVRALMAEVQ